MLEAHGEVFDLGKFLSENENNPNTFETLKDYIKDKHITYIYIAKESESYFKKFLYANRKNPMLNESLRASINPNEMGIVAAGEAPEFAFVDPFGNGNALVNREESNEVVKESYKLLSKGFIDLSDLFAEKYYQSLERSQKIVEKGMPMPKEALDQIRKNIQESSEYDRNLLQETIGDITEVAGGTLKFGTECLIHHFRDKFPELVGVFDSVIGVAAEAIGTGISKTVEILEEKSPAAVQLIRDFASKCKLVASESAKLALGKSPTENQKYLFEVAGGIIVVNVAAKGINLFTVRLPNPKVKYIDPFTGEHIKMRLKDVPHSSNQLWELTEKVMVGDKEAAVVDGLMLSKHAIIKLYPEELGIKSASGSKTVGLKVKHIKDIVKNTKPEPAIIKTPRGKNTKNGVKYRSENIVVVKDPDSEIIVTIYEDEKWLNKYGKK